MIDSLQTQCRVLLHSWLSIIVVMLISIALIRTALAQFTYYFPAATGGGGTSTPMLIQHTSSATNPVGTGIAGNAFQMPIHPTGAGNTIVLGITWVNGRTMTITDSAGDASPAAVCTADAGVGNYIAGVYIFQPTTGTTWIKATASGANFQPFQYVISEFNNISTTTTQGSLCTPSITPGAGGVIDPGLMTITNNNATGGNLLWSYAALASSAGANPTSWVPATSFKLLNSEIIWTSNQGFPEASEYFVQTAQANLNPKLTATGDTTDIYNSVSLALKVGSAGTAAPSTIHVAKIIHETLPGGLVTPVTVKIQVPFIGNLRVLTFESEDTNLNTTAVTYGDGCTATKVQPVAGESKFWYAQNCSANEGSSAANQTVNITISAISGTPSFRVFDVVAADPSSFQSSAGTASTTCSSVTTINNQPTITPGISAGLAIAIMGIGQGPGLGLAAGSPIGARWDLILFTGQTDLDLMDNADAVADLIFSSNATQNWNWTITSIASNSCFAASGIFK